LRKIDKGKKIANVHRKWREGGRKETTGTSLNGFKA
jgi:hypothetical protein